MRAESGAVIVIHQGDRTATISEQQISGNADTDPAHHAGRNADGSTNDGNDTPRSLSLAKLLELSGLSAKYIELPRSHSGDFLLEPSGYQGVDGPIVFWVDSGSIHYFRPLDPNDPQDTGDNYATPVGSSELELTLHAGNILDVSAGVSPAAAKAGERVYFHVDAKDKVAGEKLTYKWDFGDGGTGVGKTPTYIYKKRGAWTAAVTVTGDKDSKGGDSVPIDIAKPPKAPAHTGSNSGDRNEQQNNNSSGGTGNSSGGTSNSGGTSSGGTSTPTPTPVTPTPQATPAPSPAPSPSPSPSPKPKQPKFTPSIPTDVSGLTPISGVLISDVRGSPLPAGEAPLTVLKTAQRAKAAAIADPTSAEGSLPLGIAAALTLLGVGALRERRR